MLSFYFSLPLMIYFIVYSLGYQSDSKESYIIVIVSPLLLGLFKLIVGKSP